MYGSYTFVNNNRTIIVVGEERKKERRERSKGEELDVFSCLVTHPTWYPTHTTYTHSTTDPLTQVHDTDYETTITRRDLGTSHFR